MVVSGLQAFHTRLAACRPPLSQANSLLGQAVEAGDDGDDSKFGKPPLFRVRSMLPLPGWIYNPARWALGCLPVRLA